jgi:serine/threonine protein kinase
LSERIGRYELVKPLAEGDRGKLYLARSTGYGGFARHVVIKTFEQLPGAAEGPFIEETLDLGRLHHQHITPILDVGRDGDRFFVALDFVHGRSAREVWHRTFTLGALLPLDFAFTVVTAIAAGLHHAHTRRRADGSPLGLVHGHVSLSNVLVGFDGTVQLIGFAGASARHLRASDTQLGFSKDQLAYLAPEQARRQPIDPRSDVFALGILLYELTTMRRAFRDDSDRLTIERVKIGSYVRPRAINPDYPPELERIIARALQLEPGARYQNVEMMRRELAAIGHHRDLVIGDAAIVEVMAQLFEDGAVDPWTSSHTADTSPDALAPELPATDRRRPLRAATETVDALAIELEIPVEDPADRRDTDPVGDTRTTTPAKTIANDIDEALDTRTTTPAKTIGNDTDGALAPRTTTPANALGNDTDGVPVLVPLPTTRAASDPPPRAPVAAKSLPRAPRKIHFRWIALGAALATVGVTTAIALALRGTDAASPAAASPDAAPSVTIDAAVVPPDTAALVAGIDAAIPDASTTVRLRITSTPSGTVLLDGKKLGKTPFEGVVDRAEGTHVLKVRKSGYVTGKVEVELTSDVTHDLVLVREAQVDDRADGD